MANWEHVRRKYLKIERPTINDVVITFECGHVSTGHNPIFRYELDTHGHCYSCAEKEFNDKLKRGE
jgi:hypothetical protein